MPPPSVGVTGASQPPVVRANAPTVVVADVVVAAEGVNAPAHSVGTRAVAQTAATAVEQLEPEPEEELGPHYEAFGAELTREAANERVIAWQRERAHEKYSCQMVEVKVRPHLFKGFIHTWVEKELSAVELDNRRREEEAAQARYPNAHVEISLERQEAEEHLARLEAERQAREEEERRLESERLEEEQRRSEETRRV